MYELLTTKPLFPGKHEVDQISRIHAVLGTPSRSLLEQFCRNPNTQMNLKFAPREAQDFHRLLPKKTSEETIDLLGQLLRYNPQDRITASDALRNHPAFSEIRELEESFKESGMDQTIPFSQYFLSHASRKEAPDPVRIEMLKKEYRKPVVYPVCEPPKILVQGARPALYQGPNVDMKIAIPPVKLGGNRPAVVRPAAVYPPKNGTNSNADLLLCESRMKAAQRIKAYQRKVHGKFNHKSFGQCYHGAAYQLPRNVPAFEKPKLELICPRLQKVL
jgi:renal tumor antigen